MESTEQRSIGLLPTSRVGKFIPLSLLLGCALALRMWRISDKNLGLDESTSWFLATGSVPHLLAWTANDVHPPLYYLLLKVWLWCFGDSLTALRTLSVTGSVVALYLLYRLIDDAMPRPVCYAVLLWSALSPLALDQAQETRMYPWATAAVLAACVSYRRWVDTGGVRPSALLLYGVSVTTALYLHYYTALAITAIWLHFIIAGARQTRPERTSAAWKAWIVAHVGVALAYAPWIPTAIAQVGRGQAARPPVTIGEVPDHARLLIKGLMFGDRSMPDLLSWQGVFAVGLLTAGAVCLLWVIVRLRDEQDMFFACVAYLPPLPAILLLPLSGALELWWYLPGSSLLMVAAAARGLSRIGVGPSAVVGLLCAGTLALLPSVFAYYSAADRDSDVGPVVAYLLAHARSGVEGASDPVYVKPIYLETKINYYARDALSLMAVPRDADLASLGLDRSSGRDGAWLIVDMHSQSPKLAEVAEDARLHPVEVPGNNPKRVQLFRLPTD
ncbi:glycosyltransferase family 39 protein [Mycobacterium sp. SMC-4]|uniref:glycosyltransferase family 39 protein n=1 Tax=Mycobacterium sp. SMC-4 TaxID=2857059 RepID=UPI003D03108F